jgi:hypothetical protein
MEKKIFYVYGHYRADTGEIFYIGKGHGKRAWVRKGTDGRSDWWHRIVNKHGYTVKLLHEQLTEDNALQKERELIQLYGRQNIGTGPLVNLTDGGEGGLNVGEDTRKKRSESVKKITDNEHYRKELSARVKRQWDNNPERKKKTSEQVKARLASDEDRQALRDRVKRSWDADPDRKRRTSERAKIDNAKTYDGLYDPQGVFHGPITNLPDFCKFHNLSLTTTRGLFYGKHKHSRGWTIDKPTFFIYEDAGIVHNNA